MVKEYTTHRKKIVDSLLQKLTVTGLPIGWNIEKGKNFLKEEGGSEHWLVNILLMLIGIAIGAGCISMGAPFWFDLLNKLVNLRRSGIKPKQE